MAVLAHCWFIIEYCLIPDGFRRWFFLSFYINPFFLIFCQIFLWIKTLKRWIFNITFLLNRYLFLRILGVLKRVLIINSSSSGFSDSSTKPEDEEDLWYEVTDSFSSSDTTSGILFLCYENSCLNPKVAFCDFRFESIFDQETTSVCSSSNLDDEITSFSVASSSISSYSFPSRRDLKAISSTRSSTCTTLLEDQEDANDDGVDHYGLTDFRISLQNNRVSPTVTSVDSVSDCDDTHLFSSDPLPIVKPDEEEKDSFYKLYTERMKWFDLLHQERTSELDAFLTKKEHMGGEKRIIKSLENDFEMVYVAQSCLSWEALHYQYRKLDSIIISYADTICTSSPYGGALCSSSLVNKFQRFQILLERFMEDERSEKGKRYSNFIQKRSSLNSLLQVPYISEKMNVYKDGRNKGLTIRATDLLKTIEKCMKTFKSFIELEERRPWWRAHSRFSWNCSPLEDPRDFNLLRKLTHTLQQKELWMKDLYGKQRCWLRRRVKTMEDVQKKEMMFAMIDLKLVSRVLMMSLISTSQLHWCQQKLDNIEISHGRITRSSSCIGSLLFPPS